MYVILAPQDGQIVRASKSGIGEILKDGETITVIVPSRADYAVEMYVTPVDLPLINIGQKVRFMFDGFPAIVFIRSIYLIAGRTSKAPSKRCVCGWKRMSRR